MRGSQLTLLIVALAVTPPVAAQVPVPTRPPETTRPTPVRPVTPSLERYEALALEVALAPLAATLPQALSAVGMALPYALDAADMALNAARFSLPHSLEAASMGLAAAEAGLPHALALPRQAGDDFADLDADSPEPWAPQDPADSLYRAARVALNANDFSRAAELFSRIHTEARFRGSEYRAISYYYDAFARSRVGGRAQLQRARTALDAMRREHATAWNDQRDAAALLTRIEAELARQGDAAAAREVQVRANAASRDPCTDANLAVKVEAINALMQMDAASAMPILEEVIKNKSTDACTADLRRRAIFIISQQRTDRSAAILLETARNDPDSEVRGQAVFFLSQVGTNEALAALESILTTSDNADVRQQALFAISQHRSPRAGELLRDFAVRTDVSAEQRGQALFFLGQRGHQSAENARFLRELYPRLNDPEVRQKALFAISQTRGEESADWLLARALDQNESMEVRKQALFFAAQQRALPIARLSELYDRVNDRELKAHIAFVVSQRGRDPEAVDLLMKIARDDQNPELRKQAIFWLGQSRDPRAAAFLLELIKR
jgi:HEAT repeat protein